MTASNSRRRRAAIPVSSSSTAPECVEHPGIPAYPCLRPGTTVAWGSDGAAIIGARPGVRIYGGGAQLYPLVRAIASLDGSRATTALVEEIPPMLLASLADAGCVIPAPTQAVGQFPAQIVDACRSRVVDADADDAVAVAVRRRAARVAVRGDTYLAASAMGLLRAAGVGVVEAGSDDSRATAALVLHHVDQDQVRLAADASDPWLRLGLPHVVATVSGTRMLIGPVTIPGETACSRCVHLWLSESLSQTAASGDAYQPVAQRPSRSLEAASICAAVAVGRLLLAVDGLLDISVFDATLLDSAGRAEPLRIAPSHDCGCRDLRPGAMLCA